MVLRPLSPLFILSFFLLHQLKQKETIERIVWNKIFHALTVTAFRYMPLDKPNGILTMTFLKPGPQGGGGDSRGKVIAESECLGSRNLPSGIL